MKFIRTTPHLFIVIILIVSILIFLNSIKKNWQSNAYYSLQYNDFNVLAHPEKYFLYDSHNKSLELNCNKTFQENSDAWTEFLPELYIHSAFGDEAKNTSETLIRILAVGPRLHLYKYNLQCVFKINETQWENALVDYSTIRHWSFRYLMFICISKSKTLPEKIRLENKLTEHKSTFLDIHYQEKKCNSKQEVTVCVLPTFKDSNNIHLLAEFLSYHNTVGVNSFIFYDYNMTNDMICFINKVHQYRIKTKIIPWKIPNATRFPRQRILEIASIQHCIFENRGRTDYILPLNIDEFLVPRQHFSLTELMNELSTISKQKIGSYIFRQSNFCSKNISKKKDDNLVTSTDLFREDKIFSAKKQSRYIVKPETVAEGGLYDIHKHIKGWKSANVPWQLALVHHYTMCPKEKNISKLIEDRTAESFKYEILLSKPMTLFRNFKSIK